METIVNLGKKTLGWKLKIFFLSPLWATSTSPTRKSWSEFKYGLIDHEHEWGETYVDENGFDYADCKHHGCNVVTVPSLMKDKEQIF